MIYLTTISSFLLNSLLVLLMIAIFTASERKILAAIQHRHGPIYVGFWGLLQPFSDGIKLILKEIHIPTKANSIIFILGPVIIFSLSLTNWINLPLSKFDIFITNSFYQLFFILIISSLGVYGLILSGWSSNSRYALYGSIRSIAQLLSYEIFLTLIFSVFLLNFKTLNITMIVEIQKELWNFHPLLIVAIIFFIAIVAEANRAPFDLPEAEAELVAGPYSEYSAITFAFFFLSEYGNMIFLSILYTNLFLGGWYTFGYNNSILFYIKILSLCFLFILIRASFPRIRFDQLLTLGWKIFLPILLSFICFNSLIMIYFC